MPGKLPHPSMFAPIPLIILLSLAKLDAQQTNPTITGTVTTATGAAIPNAKVTAKNLTTGDTTSAQSDATGHFHFDALPPADYEISASADGLATQASKVTVTAGTSQTVNLALTSAKPEGNLPNAPSSSRTEPSLSDLGFTPEQTQGNAKQQALLGRKLLGRHHNHRDAAPFRLLRHGSRGRGVLRRSSRGQYLVLATRATSAEPTTRAFK